LKKTSRRLRGFTERNVTEKEINEKYPQVAASLGQRVYMLCLPIIEIVDHLGQMLQMNREMSKIKQIQAEAQKQSEEKTSST